MIIDINLDPTEGSETGKEPTMFGIIDEIKFNMTTEKENWKSKEKTSEIEQLKQKTIELEKLLAEKTAELVLKNRHLQVEAALERVRSRTMRMQESDELAETASMLFKQLLRLGVSQLRTCGISTFHESEPYGELFMADIDGEIMYDSFKVPYDEAPVYKEVYQAWKNGENFRVVHITGKALIEHFAYVKEYIGAGNIDLSRIGSEVSELYFHAMFFSQGHLFVVSYQSIAEHYAVLKRFGALFQQTYTRFLDFKKSEAQTREAQIETALERVRSRTMAMQKSNELPEVANVLFLQMQSLAMPDWNAGYCIWDEDKKGANLWMSREGVIQPPFHAPLTKDPSFIHMRESYEKGETFHIEQVSGEALVSHYQYMRTLPVAGEILHPIIAADYPLPTLQIFHCVYFSQGFLLFITYEPVPDAHSIFNRFGKVFDQTYTRFLDLQKAEAQANVIREEQIRLKNTLDELHITLQIVEQERQKSDRLLLNILPAETAIELKETGQAQPVYYKQISVLFTDFKGFTKIAEKISPQEVIENLNTCFLAFDEICERHNLEKIKTIGDSYMCAGGLPIPNESNPFDIVSAGLEMQQWMARWKAEKEAKGELAWELRMGIHSGEAIAGVIGKYKFAYDIWGDTVNLASRMESSGEAGKVNISSATYKLVKDIFQCTYRGKIEVKNKGKVAMYFVEGIL